MGRKNCFEELQPLRGSDSHERGPTAWVTKGGRHVACNAVILGRILPIFRLSCRHFQKKSLLLGIRPHPLSRETKSTATLSPSQDEESPLVTYSWEGDAEIFFAFSAQTCYSSHLLIPTGLKIHTISAEKWQSGRMHTPAKGAGPN